MRTCSKLERRKKKSVKWAPSQPDQRKRTSLERTVLSYTPLDSLLLVTVITSFCADYCTFTHFNVVSRRLNLKIFISGCFNWRNSRTLQHPKTFHWLDFASSSREQLISIPMCWGQPLLSGQCCRTRNLHLDGYEKQDGVNYRSLRR